MKYILRNKEFFPYEFKISAIKGQWKKKAIDKFAKEKVYAHDYISKV